MDTKAVKRLAADLGFALCGVTEARASDYQPELAAWLGAGRHGSMRWLAEHADVRADPQKLLPGARSVICVADRIGPGDEPPPSQAGVRARRDSGVAGSDRRFTGRMPVPPRFTGRMPAPRTPGPLPGRIARYAQVDDYHKIIKKRLFRLADALRGRAPEHRHRVCVDTAPILEREHAMRAGLGWVGKNTLLIHPFAGSHLLLGEIVTTLPLAPDAPEADHCGSCTRCIDACPTGCITPYSVDASRCISYLTIEHRGAIDERFHEPIGDWLYGCDICQDVCPYNAPGRAGPAPADLSRRAEAGEDEAGRDARPPQPSAAPTPPEYNQRPAAMDALDVLNWTEADRRAAFTRSAMKRAKLDQMKRNALIVAANHLRRADDPDLLTRIEHIAADPEESPLVRRTAQQVLERMPRSAAARA